MAMTGKSFKELVKKWILLEMIIAGLIAVHLGVEGLAFEFCNYVPVQTCEEVEWSDDHQRARDQS